MAPLRNVRHEKFCQALLEGRSATAAYAQAGYVRDEGNAARLRVNPRIEERLAELQGEIAKETKVTVESICRELDEANQVAKERGQASAMVSASALRAKLAGLMVDKVEVGPAGAFDKCESIEAIADEMLTYDLNPAYEVATDRDRQELIDMLKRNLAAVAEFIAGIKARPVPSEYVYKARRAEVRRLGNGKARA